MVYVTVDFAISFLEAICCQMFFDIFIDGNHGRKNKLVKMIVVVILGLLYFGIGRLLAQYFLIKEFIVIAITALTMIVAKGAEIKRAFILALLFQGLLVAMEYLAYIFMQIIVSDAMNVSNKGMMNSFVAIIDMLLVFSCVVLIRRMFKGYNNKILYDEEWLKFIIFPIFTIITIAAFISSFGSLDDVRQIRMLYVISIGLIMMNFYVFYILEDIAKKGELAREKEIFELQGKEQLEMYNALNDSFEKQKAESHEFKNHILCIQALAENGEYENLTEYVKSMSRQEQSVINVIDTNNVIINTVVNAKYQEAISKHIVFTFRINDLSGIKMSEKDIVIILSNMLNNAIEACEQCKDNRVIKLKFIRENGGTILSVKNTFSKPVIRQGDIFLTTKDYEKSSHGVGIRNIIKVINKYNGREK